MRPLGRIRTALVAVIAPIGIVQAQDAAKPGGSGLFLGFGVEATTLSYRPATGGDTSHSGSGGALTIGYGFGPRWALFGRFSGATLLASDGNYSAGNADIGGRLLFRNDRAVMPFIHFGVSGTSETHRLDDGTGRHTYESSGGAVFFGGGVAAHFNRQFAFVASLTLAGGQYTLFRRDKVDIVSSALPTSSSRLHLGLLWYPKG